jgi:superfamily II DNA or RNA helicase
MSSEVQVVRRTPRPRRWQAEALATWAGSGARGVVEVVTGGGKTTYAGLCIERFLTNERNARVNIVVPTVALLDQWYVALQEDFGVEAGFLTAYSGEGTPDTPGIVNILVVNTARLWAERLAAGQRTMLVVDECHRAGSPENARVLLGPHAATLGLSATPRREYDDAFETIVAPALGQVIYAYDYNQARADGVITAFELRNVRVPLSEPERQKYDALTRRVATMVRRYNDGQDVEDRLKRILRDRANVSARASVRGPAAVALAERHRGERVIVFHEAIASANEIASTLARRGHRVAVYHSGIGPDLRRDNLRLFRRGMLDVLVTCRALDEGVNVPEASVAVIASSTSSTRQRVQRLGRVLRPAPGKSSAVIYTIYATDTEERRLRTEESNLDSADRISWMSGAVAENR